MVERCGWPGDNPIYQAYHDTEWGVPEYDSQALWEKLILDGFQAGLSWITILKKRDNFRKAFARFDPNIVAQWGEEDVERLLGNAGIIRPSGRYRRRSQMQKHGKRSKQSRDLISFCGPMWTISRW